MLICIFGPLLVFILFLIATFCWLSQSTMSLWPRRTINDFVQKCYCLLVVILKLSEVHQYFAFYFPKWKMNWLLSFRRSFRFVHYYYVSINKLLIFFLLFYPRDGNLPVSFIQKYLMKKLDLTSEVEVSFQSHALKLINGAFIDFFSFKLDNYFKLKLWEDCNRYFVWLSGCTEWQTFLFYTSFLLSFLIGTLYI